MASRGLWHFMGARTRRGLALSWSALFVLSLLLQYFSFAFASPTLAVHDEGLFELDGNATDSAAIEPDDDWDSLNHALDSIFIPGSAEKDGSETTYFKGGGSKDVNDISDWGYSANDVAPDKDEILDAYAAAYEKGGTRSPTSALIGSTARATRSSASGSSRTRSAWAPTATSRASTRTATSSSCPTSRTAGRSPRSRSTNG